VSQFISELIKKYYNENGSDHSSTTTPAAPEEAERGGRARQGGLLRVRG